MPPGGSLKDKLETSKNEIKNVEKAVKGVDQAVTGIERSSDAAIDACSEYVTRAEFNQLKDKQDALELKIEINQLKDKHDALELKFGELQKQLDDLYLFLMWVKLPARGA